MPDRRGHRRTDPSALTAGRARSRLPARMAKRDAPFERHVRAALTRLHDLPYLQTHPLSGLRGKALQSALTDAVQALRSGPDGTSGRTQRLLALRYLEAMDSKDVAAQLGVSMG